MSPDKSNEGDLLEAGRAQFDVDPSKPRFERHHTKRKIQYTPGPLRFHCFTSKGCWIIPHRQAFRSPNSPWAASMENLSSVLRPEIRVGAHCGKEASGVIAHDPRP
jgi:hypothetical protein